MQSGFRLSHGIRAKTGLADHQSSSSSSSHGFKNLPPFFPAILNPHDHYQIILLKLSPVEKPTSPSS